MRLPTEQTERSCPQSTMLFAHTCTHRIVLCVCFVCGISWLESKSAADCWWPLPERGIFFLAREMLWLVNRQRGAQKINTNKSCVRTVAHSNGLQFPERASWMRVLGLHSVYVCVECSAIKEHELARQRGGRGGQLRNCKVARVSERNGVHVFVRSVCLLSNCRCRFLITFRSELSDEQLLLVGFHVWKPREWSETHTYKHIQMASNQRKRFHRRRVVFERDNCACGCCVCLYTFDMFSLGIQIIWIRPKVYTEMAIRLVQFVRLYVKVHRTCSLWNTNDSRNSWELRQTHNCKMVILATTSPPYRTICVKD